MIGVAFSIAHDDGYADRYKRLYGVFDRFGIVEDRTTSCVFLNTDDREAVDLALYGALEYTEDKAITVPAHKHSFIYFGPK